MVVVVGLLSLSCWKDKMEWAGEAANLSWRSCKFELQIFYFYFSQVSCSGRVRVLPSYKPLGGLLSSGVGGRSLVVEEKAPPKGVGKRSCAEALVGMGQSPKTTSAVALQVFQILEYEWEGWLAADVC
jgi:hypothetical protein